MSETPTGQIIALTLFYREGCHLCEVMLNDLQPYLQRSDIRLSRVDIDEHPEWLDAYNSLIPVLHVDDEPVCKYTLDTAKLDQFLND